MLLVYRMVMCACAISPYLFLPLETFKQSQQEQVKSCAQSNMPLQNFFAYQSISLILKVVLIHLKSLPFIYILDVERPLDLKADTLFLFITGFVF